jgi:hypothetical protein
MNKILSLLMAGLLGLAAPVSVSAKTPDDTFVLAINMDDIISLDPAEVFELIGGEVIANIYDRITTHEPEDLTELVGGVAESWEVSEDGRTITLKVRPDQTFHSGNPVTAEDAAWSLQRAVILDKTPIVHPVRHAAARDPLHRDGERVAGLGRARHRVAARHGLAVDRRPKGAELAGRVGEAPRQERRHLEHERARVGSLVVHLGHRERVVLVISLHGLP